MVNGRRNGVSSGRDVRHRVEILDLNPPLARVFQGEGASARFLVGNHQS